MRGCVRLTADLNHAEVVWWAVSLLFAAVAGGSLGLETGNVAVAVVIGGMVLANGLWLRRASA